MINKPVLKNPHLILMGSPKTISIKKPTIAAPFEYNSVLEFLKSSVPTEDNYYELQEEQRDIIKQLFAKMDKIQATKYVAEKIQTSRFKSFRMAMTHFKRICNSHFEGNLSRGDLDTYIENIPSTAGEHWYEEFNDVRRYFFQGITSNGMPNGHCFGQALDILINAESFKNDPEFPNGGFHQDVEMVKIANRYIIDLAEIVWPNEAKSLKLLFGK